MLPAGARLRRSADFTATMRSSRAARGDGMLVLHAAVPAGSPPGPMAPPGSTAPPGPMTPTGSPAPAGGPPRVGFVVPRAVGPAVTRNLVRRRLRHLVRERLALLPAGTRLVVRVLPPAAGATYAMLGGALDRALERALDRALEQARHRAGSPGARSVTS